jgi:hypothetical protein
MKIKYIKKLEAIFPVWKTYNQHVDKIRLAPSNVMQEKLEKLIKETKHNYLPESQEISSKDPFHRIIEMVRSDRRINIEE